jgi:hypothetical protein
MTDDNTALYFADGRAFGAAHAAPALTDAPEVGRMSASIAAIDRAETPASELAHERAAHQLTVLELTSCREDRDEAAATRNLDQSKIEVLINALTAAREEAGVTLQAAQAEIARLTAVIADLRYVAAAQLEELNGLHASRDTERCNATAEIAELNDRVLRISADLDAQVSAHPGADPEGDETLVFDVPDIDPATLSIMDWIIEAVSIDRARATYSPLVALSDLIAEWVESTKACEAFRGGANAGKPSPAGECALERLDTVERMLAMAGAR